MTMKIPTIALLIWLFGPACASKSDSAAGGSSSGAKKPSAFPVEVAPVETRKVQYTLTAVGSVEAFETVQITARVARFSDGRFNLRGHIAMKVNMGRCVVLEIGSIKVVVSEFAGPGHDPEVFRHIGLDPKEAQIVVVKATVGHMDAYRDIMKENLPTECPGPSPSYLERLDYRHIPKPMYPFDKEMKWTP